MRTFVLFALALAGTAVLTDDASAFGKRKRGGSSSGCCDGGYGMSGGGYGSSGAGYGASAPCCGGSAAAMPGGYPGHVGYGSGAVGRQGATVQATDGQFYTMGTDGSYYAASPGTLGGFTSQPSSSYYPGTYRGANPYQGVMPAGYPGTPGYAYPAGGIPPLTMPGVLPLRR